ncbi:MAG: cell division protein ZapE [Gallionella sp.]
MDPRTWYQTTSDKAGFVCDEAQSVALEELEILWQQLITFKEKRQQFLGHSLFRPDVPRGLYLWGGVGRGKTFLMDGFYHCLPYSRKRRIHFHNFMCEVHHEMKLLAHEPDPLIALADNMAHATRLLCLDEFHVDDIADAMILSRLLAALFKRGVVLLTTSNYPPDGLYPNGLQRQNFLPAIELLKQQLKVLHFDGNKDYRLLHRVRDPIFIVSVDASKRMEAMFERLTRGMNEEATPLDHLPVRGVRRDVIWFDFTVLCGGNHDQSDYLLIAHRYHTVFLSDVPVMGRENSAEAKRFTWLIDVLYDNNVKLVASLEVIPENLYEAVTDESQRIVSRLIQMQTHRYLALPHHTRGVTLTDYARP